jgi:hypothetical protein
LLDIARHSSALTAQQESNATVPISFEGLSAKPVVLPRDPAQDGRPRTSVHHAENPMSMSTTRLLLVAGLVVAALAAAWMLGMAYVLTN